MPSCLACFLPKLPIFRLLAKGVGTWPNNYSSWDGPRRGDRHLFCTGIGKTNY